MQTTGSSPTVAAAASIATAMTAVVGDMNTMVAIVIAALGGSLYVLQREVVAGRLAGFLLLSRLMLISVSCTGFVSWYLETHYQWPTEHTAPLVSAMLATFGDRIPGIGDWLIGEGKRRIGGQQSETSSTTDDMGGSK